MTALRVVLLLSLPIANALNVLLAGGTGEIGRGVAGRLKDHSVIILTRNAFLAATPSRVTEQFGWVGEKWLKQNPHVRLRDWDGGDLLDIVGKDWIGWQEDALEPADVVVHLTGGYTPQRIMAVERVVRESLSYNRDALQVVVSPSEEDLPGISPGLLTLKKKRLSQCEEVVNKNCANSLCLRLEGFRVEQGCDKIVSAIEEWKSKVVA